MKYADLGCNFQKNTIIFASGQQNAFAWTSQDDSVAFPKVIN